jgi:hypothetical protein
MTGTRVLAVLLPGAGAAAAPTLAAFESLTRGPDTVALPGPREELTPQDCDWVWLLEAGLLPEPPALERLLDAVAPPAEASAEAADRPLRLPPVLAASRVLAADGGLDPAAAPVPEIRRPERVLAALEQGHVALRAARARSLLVRADAVRAAAPGPATDLAGTELTWTARLLRAAPGVLVPDSVVVRSRAARGLHRPPPARRAASTLRLLRGLESNEQLWFGSYLLERASASLRERLSSGPREDP